MNERVIEINNLGKQYRLGQVGSTTLGDDLKRWWYSLRGKEDPFLKIGEENDRTKKGESDFVWAVKNINFNVDKGDVLGIIGKNGAGKSTLLKILSRTTSPTVGEYKIKGRVASLLEVGTGFHPDLTGRENVFLNGAILGMTKNEIKRNFDEIVSFSGVERYIDTPVKRYSSGMYVRLAFAVAAHLEPEILIVDEVLAVGDAEFRKKCLGKMSEVSKFGRTVLFVSHELSAISSICNKGLLLKNGRIESEGLITKVLNDYMSGTNSKNPSLSWEEKDRPGDEHVKLNSIRVLNMSNILTNTFYLGEDLKVEIDYEVISSDNLRVNPGISIYTATEQLVTVALPNKSEIKTNKGFHTATCYIKNSMLNEGIYNFRINAHTFYPTILHFDLKDIVTIEIIEKQVDDRTTDYKDKLLGIIRPEFEWKIN
jgi:lipopolysaccharide transport system ATP-binding protein